ncbi:MAG TPA: hypothetical protein P5560_14650 [Thermotogota bacterium]|nr:hypothetical protein [Thermotogota bacterium]HRW94191.1 hypothetical protein [Thermotogota bacterium]
MEDFYKQSWQGFLETLEADIFPYYREHEQSFDRWSVHGRMHIGRAVIFSEVMNQYYLRNTDQIPSSSAIRYAVAFHDAGRQGNGWDVWEEDSATLCAGYLEKILPPAEAHSIGLMISKKGKHTWNLDRRIVHDADVLEIMRPICGHGGRMGFRKGALRFLGKRDPEAIRNKQVRDQLIDQAWFFIRETERNKEHFLGSKSLVQEFLGFLQTNATNCPFLVEYLPV